MFTVYHFCIAEHAKFYIVRLVKTWPSVFFLFHKLCIHNKYARTHLQTVGIVKNICYHFLNVKDLRVAYGRHPLSTVPLNGTAYDAELFHFVYPLVKGWGLP